MKKITMPIFLILLLLVMNDLQAQNFDYHLDESPAISWNGSGFYDARLISCGGISLFVSDAFAQFLNPAMAPEGVGLKVGLTLTQQKYGAFQYWGINQGVMSTEDPVSQLKLGVGGFTASFSLIGVSLSAGWVKTNLLQRPDFEYLYDYSRGQYYSFSGVFSGNENSFFFAASIGLGRKLNLGVKIDYTYGQREVVISEISNFYYYINDQWVIRQLLIIQDETHQCSRLNSTIGVLLKFNPSFSVGAIISMPLGGWEKRSKMLSFQNFEDDINYEIPGSGDDIIEWPWRLSLAARYKILIKNSSGKNKSLTLGTEFKFVSWSNYSYSFFAEELLRDFRDTLIWSLGMEYEINTGNKSKYFRLGFKNDPQPLKDPQGSLKFLSTGIGVKVKKFFADLGISYITGSFGGISQNHFILNTTIQVKF